MCLKELWYELDEMEREELARDWPELRPEPATPAPSAALPPPPAATEPVPA